MNASNELVQKKKKISMNLISINHAFYFLIIYGLKAYNMYIVF